MLSACKNLQVFTPFSYTFSLFPSITLPFIQPPRSIHLFLSLHSHYKWFLCGNDKAKKRKCSLSQFIGGDIENGKKWTNSFSLPPSRCHLSLLFACPEHHLLPQQKFISHTERCLMENNFFLWQMDKTLVFNNRFEAQQAEFLSPFLATMMIVNCFTLITVRLQNNQQKEEEKEWMTCTYIYLLHVALITFVFYLHDENQSLFDSQANEKLRWQ